MKSHLNEMFLEMIINNILTEKERLFYKKVLNTENNIAGQASTSEQFIERLQESCLYERVAKEYQLTVPKVLEVLKSIEEKIDQSIEEMKSETSLIDCTSLVQSANSQGGKKLKLFYTEGI